MKFTCMVQVSTPSNTLNKLEILVLFPLLVLLGLISPSLPSCSQVWFKATWALDFCTPCTSSPFFSKPIGVLGCRPSCNGDFCKDSGTCASYSNGLLNNTFCDSHTCASCSNGFLNTFCILRIAAMLDCRFRIDIKASSTLQSLATIFGDGPFPCSM